MANDSAEELLKPLNPSHIVSSRVVMHAFTADEEENIFTEQGVASTLISIPSLFSHICVLTLARRLRVS